MHNSPPIYVPGQPVTTIYQEHGFIVGLDLLDDDWLYRVKTLTSCYWYDISEIIQENP